MARKTPICDAVKDYAAGNPVRWHMPGHQGGRTVPGPLAAWGESLWRSDITEVPGLDNLMFAEGVIAESEALTARSYGADRTYYLTQGSTAGIHAAFLACLKPGDKVIVPRAAHVSVWHALVLSGAEPVYLMPSYDSWGMVEPFSTEEIARLLGEDEDIRAVVLQNPTYDGKAGNIAAAAELAHSRGIPLIVDEAHGAHWHFSDLLPLSAVDAGADIVVQSAHKTLPALTGTAWVHLQGNLVSPERLAAARRAVHSTSPSYLMLASLDACGAWLEDRAEAAYRELFSKVGPYRRKLSSYPHLRLAEGTGQKWDFTKLNLHFSVKHTAVWVNISRKYGIMYEKRVGDQILILLTSGTRTEELELLDRSCAETQDGREPLFRRQTTVPHHSGGTALSPRSVFFSGSETVAVSRAAGRIAKDVVMHYPPGIPLILPGEVYSEALVDYILEHPESLSGLTESDGSPAVKVIL